MCNITAWQILQAQSKYVIVVEKDLRLLHVGMKGVNHTEFEKKYNCDFLRWKHHDLSEISCDEREPFMTHFLWYEKDSIWPTGSYNDIPGKYLKLRGSFIPPGST